MPRSLLKIRKISSIKARNYDSSASMEEKIKYIEMTLAHQEQTITELSDVITEQWKEIELLKRRLDKTLAKIEQLEHGEEIAADKKPPHY